MKQLCLLLFLLLNVKLIQSQALTYQLKDLESNTVFTVNSAFNHSIAASSRHSQTFELKNTGSVAHVFRLTKIDVWRNIVAVGDSSYAHFCLGLQCFDASTKTATFSLNTGEVMPLIFEMDEASVIGQTTTKYDIISDLNDKLTLMLKYNYATTPVIEISTDLSLSGIMPNPCNSQLTAEINSPEAGSSVVSLTNMLGEIVFKSSLFLQAGNNPLLLNFENLPAGVYYISITKNQSFIRQKLIIER